MSSQDEAKTAAHERHLISIHETNAALAESGQNALKGVFLLNGGALVALLALLGSLVDGPDGASIIGKLLPAMKGFAVGVGLTALGYGGTYMTNFMYVSSLIAAERIDREPFVVSSKASIVYHRIGQVLHALTILSVLAAIGAFFFGFWSVAVAFERI